MALRRHRAELDGLELSPVDVFDVFEEPVGSIDVARLLPNPLDVVREQPSAEQLRTAHIHELEQRIIATEGLFYVAGVYHGAFGAADRARRIEAERLYRAEERVAARWLEEKEG